MTALSGGVNRAGSNQTLALVGLLGRDREPVRNYSHGMRQRLGLAQALLPKPELIILDEPATGLDPEGMAEVRDLLVHLNREEGMTVFLSSHLLHEVEQICTDVGVVMKGNLVARGKVRDLLATTETVVTVRVHDVPATIGALDSFGGASEVEGLPDGVRLRCGEAALPDLNAHLVSLGIRVSAMIPERMSLEDLYLRLVKGTMAQVTRERTLVDAKASVEHLRLTYSLKGRCRTCENRRGDYWSRRGCWPSVQRRLLNRVEVEAGVAAADAAARCPSMGAVQVIGDNGLTLAIKPNGGPQQQAQTIMVKSDANTKLWEVVDTDVATLKVGDAISLTGQPLKVEASAVQAGGNLQQLAADAMGMGAGAAGGAAGGVAPAERPADPGRGQM